MHTLCALVVKASKQKTGRKRNHVAKKLATFHNHVVYSINYAQITP